jgi:OmpA-OmpF porin, OOP family
LSHAAARPHYNRGIPQGGPDVKTTILCAALLALPAVAAAQSPFAPPPPRPFYAGIALGQSKTSDELVTNRESTITLAQNISTSFDDKDTAWKAYFGYQATPWLAVELNYADLGRHSTDTTFLGGDPPTPAEVIIRREVKGFGIDLVLSTPVWQRFSVFGRVGLFRAELDASAELRGNVVFNNGNGETVRSTTQKENVTRYGIGAEAAIAPNTAVRLEWERYEQIGKKFAIGATGTTGEADTDTVTLGVVYRF